MHLSSKINLIGSPGLADFMQQLQRIYASMDNAYVQAAKLYGFTCDGCRDSCCQTRFYHHTLIEYAYLKEGLRSLSQAAQNTIKLRAATNIDAIDKADRNQRAPRRMCPLNFDTRCILYPYRPMICRLHGIPHELQKPGQQSARGTGCKTFRRRCGQKRYIRFDRTPVYQDMAELEHDVKRSMDFSGKFRMTIAEMILSDAKGMGPGAWGQEYG